MKDLLGEFLLVAGILMACGVSALLGYMEGRKDYERPPCPVYEVPEGARAINIPDNTLVFFNGKQYMFNESYHKSSKTPPKQPLR